MQQQMISFVTVLALVAMTAQQPSCAVDAFQPTPSVTFVGVRSSKAKNAGTQLSMGKGLNKFKNKQANLKRKLELAKKQKQGTDDNDDTLEEDASSPKALSDEEIKERNDRKRFEQLLKQEGGKVLSAYTSDSYLNTNQEEEEITAARAGVDRIFEGDPAPTECFEHLVSTTTENIVAKKGAGRLVPWTSKDWGIDEEDYRVIVCDPRQQSLEFHQAIKDLNAGLPKDIKDRLYFINADTPAENRRWMKKNGLDKNDTDMYCDSEDKDWMRAFTALGDKRWSMTMFIISKGRVVKLARDLDIYNACQTVSNAVKAMKNEQS